MSSALLSAAQRIEQLRQSSAMALELARLVAPAVRIEPELLRAVRLSLLAWHGPSIEADLWFSTLVRSRNAAGIVLDLEVAALLRADLQRQWHDEAQRQELKVARSVMASVHAGLSPALALEEQVAWSAVTGNIEELNDELARAVKALLEGPRPGLQAWAVQAQRRLPAESFGTAAGQALRRLTALATSQPSSARDASEVLEALPSVTLGLRRFGGRLELGALVPPAQFAIRLPDTEPRLLDVAWNEHGIGRNQHIALARGSSQEIDIGVGDARLVNKLHQEFVVPPFGRWTGGAANWTRVEIGDDTERSHQGLLFRVVGTERRHPLKIELARLPALEFYNDRDKWQRVISEALWPDQLAELGATLSDSILVVDRVAGAAPWELVSPESVPGSVAFGLRGRCVRRFATARAAGREAVDVDIPIDAVLVLARDPATRDANTRIASAFDERGYLVELHSEASAPAESMAALVRRPYRVAHFSVASSGGEVDAPPALDLGPGAALGLDDFRGLQLIPELVVIQESGPGAVRAVAWAEALLEIGVHVLLIAGRTIATAEAEIFLHAFYSGLLEGSSAAEAAWLARSETHRLHRDSLAWAAFQLYGDGDYHLPAPVGAGTSRAPAAAPMPFHEQAAVDPSLLAIVDLDRKLVPQPGLFTLRQEEQPLLGAR